MHHVFWWFPMFPVSLQEWICCKPIFERMFPLIGKTFYIFVKKVIKWSKKMRFGFCVVLFLSRRGRVSDRPPGGAVRLWVTFDWFILFEVRCDCNSCVIISVKYISAGGPSKGWMICQNYSPETPLLSSWYECWQKENVLLRDNFILSGCNAVMGHFKLHWDCFHQC